MSEKNKRYINIALVGHVANGKTTLVEKLSTVNTKRESSEKKSGRTIKLGYANCLLWKCSNCQTVHTTGQAKKKLSCCSQKLTPEYYISFSDCPGHHSYVHTMIKGVAIVDCAIVVTDVRKSTLQIQTLEHLAILEVLGLKNILVVQNKIDLITGEQCLLHYKMLMKELKNTIAENAIVIPISAQSGLGVEKLQQCIWDMVFQTMSQMRIFHHNVLTVIRSFDINKPSTGVNKLKGGVLGGTVRGEKGFSVGDDIYIYPGMIMSPTEYRPLKTKITSIFSERNSCKDMGRGGLYGIGTILDPTLTKNDRLVGCLAGKEDDLPEIITSLRMKVTRINLDEEKVKIKRNQKYRLIIGSTVVGCTAEKEKSGIFIMHLDYPICTINTKCLIYSLKGKLIGFGELNFIPTKLWKKLEIYVQNCVENNNFISQIFSDSFSTSEVESIRSYPIQNRTLVELNECLTVGDALDKMYRDRVYSNMNELVKVKTVGKWLNCLIFDRFSRNVLQTEEGYITEYVEKYISVNTNELVGKNRLKIIAPEMVRENRNVIWSNIHIFCDQIHRQPIQVCTYVKEELCMDATMCQTGLRLIKSRMNSSKLQNVLKKYIVENVACDQCKSIDTIIEKDQKIRSEIIQCNSCGSSRIK